MWTSGCIQFVTVFENVGFGIGNHRFHFDAIGMIQITGLYGFPVIGLQSLNEDGRSYGFAYVGANACNE
jgi:hypothetical protein